MASKPTLPRQLLKSSTFQDILRRVDFHAELLRRVKYGLPATVASHCLHCVAQEDGGLVVYTDSQAFATQLRFLAPSILAKLNAAGDLAIKQVTIRQFLPAPTLDKPMPPMQTPNPQAIEAVKASSRSAPGDELACAMARLGAAMERYAQQNPKKNAADPEGPDGVVSDAPL